MSNLRKAAEKALEALELRTQTVRVADNGRDYKLTMAAINALREALKETEQDWAMLEAAKESLREHMLEIQRLRALLGERNEKENNSSN